MACGNYAKVYLGCEDEYVTDKYRSLVNFTTNKIGGYPNWHENGTLSSPKCKLCGLYQLLALQLYTPLENSKYHRTLYIFACINPNCWNQDDSWTCWRVQSIENECKENSPKNTSVNVSSETFWFSDANDWGDDLNDNSSEQNGNNLLANEIPQFSFSTRGDTEENLTDDFSALHVDDLNANSPASIESPVGGGAVGRLESPQGFAEIDGEEREVVCIDTPTQPQCDLVSLLHEVTPFPIQTELDMEKKFSFVEIFISVEEEDVTSEVSQHVRDLLLEYKQNNSELSSKETSETDDWNFKRSKDSVDIDSEKYEKGIPMHGDEMFHNFICRIQQNPEQLLRYCRNNSAPMLLYPLSSHVGKCRHCGDEMTFEIQVLPTIIPKLILYPQTEQTFQIEFGTVLVYTCLRSCWSSTDLYKEEHVIVQAERL